MRVHDFAIDCDADPSLMHAVLHVLCKPSRDQRASLQKHDGPGISILDVVPQSIKHLPGATESIAARQVEVQLLVEAQLHGKSAHVPPIAAMEMSR